MHDIDPRRVVAELLNAIPLEGPSGGGRVGSPLPAGVAAVKRDASGSPAR
jgi:hypothetical protein